MKTIPTKSEGQMPSVNHSIRLCLGMLTALAALVLAAPAAASTIDLDGNDLEIDGDANSDQITVSTDGTTLTVVDTGVGGATSGGAPCIQVNGTTVACPVNPPAAPTITRFEVDLDNGVDSFTNQNFVTNDGHVHSSDGSGDPATGSKTIVGGPGSQSINGGADNDNLSGGEGDDLLTDGGDGDNSAVPTGGTDVLDGGPGEDFAAYSRSGSTPLSLSLDGVANDGQAGEADNLLNIEDVTGGEGDDTITGNASANSLLGLQGKDTISGLGGNDQLGGDFGSGSVAVLRGIPLNTGADDTLIGGPGRDGLECGGGVDVGVRDPSDDVSANCERVGADPTGDSSGLSGKKKNKFKVGIACPESEGTACSGKLSVTSNGKQIAKGKFSVAAGQTKNAKAKLSKKGAKAVKKAGGSLLVSASALTDEPGGVSEGSARLLIFR